MPEESQPQLGQPLHVWISLTGGCKRPLQVHVSAPCQNLPTHPVNSTPLFSSPCKIVRTKDINSLNASKLSHSFPPVFPLVSHLPYLLPSSVSRNPFVCHSYENCRGVYPKFPILEPVHSVPCRGAIHHSPPYSSSFFSNSSALFCTFLRPCKTQLVSFQAIPHSASKNRSGWGSASNFTVQLAVRP
jgi:hypothetical protein